MVSMRFRAPARPDVAAQVAFHFTSLGYREVQTGGAAWVFQRGSAMGAFSSVDIKSFDTSLTVRSINDSDGGIQVSCLWEVRTLGAPLRAKQTALLEAEGEELQ